MTTGEPGTGPEDQKHLNFAVLRDQLEKLFTTVENLLEREVPKKLPKAPSIGPYLLLVFRLNRQTFDAIRYLCANKTEPGESLPRPEFGLAVPPLNRVILDTSMTLTFLFEEPDARMEWFAKAGWREMRLEADQMKADFGQLPKWKAYLEETYEPFLKEMASQIGISEEEAADARTRIKYWPNPGKMVKHGIKEGAPMPASRRFLSRLDKALYGAVSQESHLSPLGVAKRGAYVADMHELDSDARRERLRGYVSDQVFMAITLMLLLSSILDERFELGLEDRIRDPWDMLAEYWDPAKLLLEVRYEAPLFRTEHETKGQGGAQREEDVK